MHMYHGMKSIRTQVVYKENMSFMACLGRIIFRSTDLMHIRHIINHPLIMAMHIGRITPFIQNNWNKGLSFTNNSSGWHDSYDVVQSLERL